MCRHIFHASYSLLFLVAIAHAQIPGSTYNWDASDPGGTPAASWVSNGPNTQAWDLTGSGGTPTINNSITSAKTLITSAYSFDGATDKGRFNPNWSGSGNSDMTIEMWIRPTDLTGQEIIWEAGGTTDGSSLALNGSVLQVTAKDGGATGFASADISGIFDVNNPDFIQIVAEIAVDAGNILNLYADGQLVDSQVVGGTWNDVIGADNNGLGGAEGQRGGNLAGGFGNFEGDISVLRFSNNSLLGQPAIQANFEALLAPQVSVPEPASIAIWAFLGAATCGFGVYRSRRQKKTS